MKFDRKKLRQDSEFEMSGAILSHEMKVHRQKLEVKCSDFEV